MAMLMPKANIRILLTIKRAYGDDPYNFTVTTLNTKKLCKEFLEKVKTGRHERNGKGPWVELYNGCVVSEYVLQRNAQFTIAVLNQIENKEKLEQELTNCLIELQKPENDNYGNRKEQWRNRHKNYRR